MDPKLHDRTAPDASATQQGKGKGRGREAATDDRQPGAGDSLMSRVGQSAAGLSRTILQGTVTPSELADVAASGKPGAPSGSRPVALGGSSATTSRTLGSNVFRSEQPGTHAAAGEPAFSDFLDGAPTLVPEEPVGLEQAWQEANRDSSGPNVYERDSTVAAVSVAEQRERDGVEVIRLLSRTDEEMPNYEGDIVVSAEELRALRQALFENGSPAQLSATDWNNALNFVPDFLRSDNSGGRGMEASENSYSNLGITEPAEASSLWLEQWNRVLTGYADEVWGDLGDLVERAQTEVREMKEGDKAWPTDAPAVRQLRSILIRVRARL